MFIVIFIVLAALFVSIVKFRHLGIVPFIPMLLCIIFLFAFIVNIANSETYLNNHPQLGGNQVGWFAGYWPLPFFGALTVIAGTPLYLKIRSRKSKSSTIK